MSNKPNPSSNGPALMDGLDCRSPATEIADADLVAHVLSNLENAGHPMRYIENEGALFRGHARAWPKEVYSFVRREWLPYEGEVPKPVTWGEFITPDQAEAWIAEEAKDA